MSTPRRSSRPSTPTSNRPTPIRTTNLHHHRTTDEIAAEEAASILHTPINRLRDSGSATSVGSELETGSARALRHKRLNQVREATNEAREREDSRSITSSRSQDQDQDELELNDDVSKSLDISVQGDQDGQSVSITNEDEDHFTSPPTALSTGQIFARPHSPSAPSKFGQNSNASSSDSDSESEDGSSTISASSSNTSDSEDNEDDDDEDDDDSDDEDMEKLLQAARAAAIAKQSDVASNKGKGKAVQPNNDGEEVVLQFDEDQKEKKKDAPIPDLSIPKLPKAHLAFTEDGKAQAHTSIPEVAQAGSSKSKRPIIGKKKQIPIPELDDRPYEKPLSKREKAAQPRKATTSELWASIPTPRSDLLPQMKRDYQALSLANSLDPKRFMKGGSKSDKIPENFAIGTMVDAPRHLQDTTLTKERKYRAGQVVKGLIQDEGTGEYAKRKYGDLQWSRMENGRGKGWKRKTKW
ncbi:uncharacterized protein L201_003305 [Kwoniella dendrophila CBS 6074]|uniref:Fcf2 pre-rRNA processing C-terminal domain-containing protein n=1 Tax=Kwoniella dendrophila CBS 6074 TaxID=1295534 RepID=A0AAX4JSV9_9TREE